MDTVIVDHVTQIDGSVTFHITVPTSSIKRADSFRMFWLADVDKSLPVVVDCEGYPIKPRLILKMFCKLPPNRAAALRKRKAFEGLRSKKPLIY